MNDALGEPLLEISGYSGALAKSIVETVGTPLLVLDSRLWVVWANAAFYRVLQCTAASTQGRSVFELTNKHWDGAALRFLLEQVVTSNQVPAGYDFTVDLLGSGCRVMHLNARKLDESTTTACNHILLTIEDVTDSRHADQAVRESEARFTAAVTALERLNVASSRLWAIGDEREGLVEVLDAAIDLLGADMGNVQLLDHNRKVLVVAASRGFEREFLDFFLAVSVDHNSACGRALRSGERIVIEDVEADELFAPFRPVARAAGFRAVQSTPLVGRDGRHLGILSTHFQVPHGLSEQDHHQLDLVARLASDFIERCRMSRALRESHDRLKKVLDVETVGVMFWDLSTGRMTDANQTFLTLMGYDREEVEAGELTWQKLTPPEYVEATLAEIKKVQVTGRIGPYEKEYFRQDGTRQWFIFAGSSLGPGTCVEFCVDISDRKRAEEALRRSEQRFRLSAEAAKLGTFDYDVPTDTNDWPPEMEAMYGLRPGEFAKTRRSWEQLLHPDDRPSAVAKVDETLATGEPVEHEWRAVWPDGSEHWIAGRFQCLKGADGTPLRLTGVNMDITQRKRAEEALRDRESRLAAILATASDAIITIDERGTINSVNSATERIFGYTRAELLGENVRTLMPQPFRGQHDGYLSNYLNTGVRNIIGIGREAQGQRKDGTVFPIELAISELFDGKRWFTGIVRDITRRRELEREVLHAAAEEEKRIGRELHDGIGQELAGLKMLADALAQRLDGSGNAEHQLAVKLVSGLSRTHEQVRTLCRGLVLTQVDGEGLRIALLELAERTRDQTGIACSFRCPRPVLTPGTGTAQHLLRIAQEAVTNAVRHGRPAHIRIELHATAHGARLCIEDDGSGVPAGGGLAWESRGLGLSSMRYRANLISGVLHISPTGGKGVRVVCVVPQEDDHAPI